MVSWEVDGCDVVALCPVIAPPSVDVDFFVVVVVVVGVVDDVDVGFGTGLFGLRADDFVVATVGDCVVVVVVVLRLASTKQNKGKTVTFVPREMQNSCI